MSGPISPDEVVEAKQKYFPPEIFEAFNEEIAKNFSNGCARVIQRDVANRIANKMGYDNTSIIYSNKYLDVEEVYRAAGWKVCYDKPAYNENYDAYFEFRKK